MPRGSGSSTRSAPPGPGARRSGRAHRAPCAHRHLPGCPVRSSGPRAPAAPAARKRGDKRSRAVRPDSVRPLPPHHRRGSSQGRNAAARRRLHSTGGDGERPGPAECPDHAEIEKMLPAGTVCPVSRPAAWRPRDAKKPGEGNLPGIIRTAAVLRAHHARQKLPGSSGTAPDNRACGLPYPSPPATGAGVSHTAVA